MRSDFSIENLGDRKERRVLTNDGYVGSVQSRDEMDVFFCLTQHLARNPCARGVRNGVMTVQQLEPVSADDLVHPYGEREIVRGKLKQRIAADIDFVKEDARKEGR